MSRIKLCATQPGAIKDRILIRLAQHERVSGGIDWLKARKGEEDVAVIMLLGKCRQYTIFDIACFVCA